MDVLFFFHAPPWFVGVYVAVVIGAFGTMIGYWFLSSTLGDLPPITTGIPWFVVGPLTSAIERLFFAMVIGFGLSAQTIAMIAWLALKATSHYNLFFRVPGQELRKRYRAMLTTIVSFMFAIVGGVVWRDAISIPPFKTDKDAIYDQLSGYEAFRWLMFFSIAGFIYFIMYKRTVRSAQVVEEKTMATKGVWKITYQAGDASVEKIVDSGKVDKKPRWWRVTNEGPDSVVLSSSKNLNKNQFSDAKLADGCSRDVFGDSVFVILEANQAATSSGTYELVE